MKDKRYGEAARNFLFAWFMMAMTSATIAQFMLHIKWLQKLAHLLWGVDI